MSRRARCSTSPARSPTRELRPAADAAEKSGTFPREAFRMLGKAGLLGLPYPERLGGGGQPYEVYLQVIEELARPG